MRLFKKYRPKDTNLNIGISSEAGQLTYYNFKKPAYNTTNSERANYLIENNITSLKYICNVDVVRLEEVFDKYAQEVEIDLLTIDVETMELNVLISNNWDVYRPKLIVMESLVSKEKSIDCLSEDEAVNYLINKGYIVVAKVTDAVFLLRN